MNRFQQSGYLFHEICATSAINLSTYPWLSTFWYLNIITCIVEKWSDGTCSPPDDSDAVHTGASQISESRPSWMCQGFLYQVPLALHSRVLEISRVSLLWLLPGSIKDTLVIRCNLHCGCPVVLYGVGQRICVEFANMMSWQYNQWVMVITPWYNQLFIDITDGFAVGMAILLSNNLIELSYLSHR